MTMKADRPEFEQLVDPDTTLTRIGEAYEFSEDPVWSVVERCLYFSDIPGDKRFRWSECAGIELVMAAAFKGNGMAFDVTACGSLCWGGVDLRTLFLTTSTTVHTMPVGCASAPLPHYGVAAR